MKKIRNMFATLISLVLMMTCMVTMASAAEIGIPESHHAMPIYVNNQLIQDMNVYADSAGEIWINYSDISRVFPNETKDMSLPALSAETPLKGWAENFGYRMNVQSNGVYLFGGSSTNPPPDVQIPENHTAIPVYVNNQRVIGANTYADQNGNLWVTYSDVFRIFPQETANMNLPATTAETSLKGWVYAFGYTMSVSYNGVLLEKSFTTQPAPEVPTTPTIPTTPSIPSTPTVPTVPTTPNSTVKVYVNDKRVNTSDVYLDANNVVMPGSMNAIYSIFPEVRNLSTNATGTPLKTLASNLGYKFVQKGIRCYLSNYTLKPYAKPVEVVLNDTILDFPDQQPIILSGRTLVPVRTFAEALGWTVDYVDGRVTISNGQHTIVLWIRSTTYTINGVEKVMDVPPQLIGSRTLIPVRLVSEAFGCPVGYDGSGEVITVTVTK